MKLTNITIDIHYDGNNVTYQAAAAAELTGGQQPQTLGLVYNQTTMPLDDPTSLTALLDAIKTKVMTQAKQDLTIQE